MIPAVAPQCELIVQNHSGFVEPLSRRPTEFDLASSTVSSAQIIRNDTIKIPEIPRFKLNVQVRSVDTNVELNFPAPRLELFDVLPSGI